MWWCAVPRRAFRLGQWMEQHGAEVFPGINVDLTQDTHLAPDVALMLPGRQVGDGLALNTPRTWWWRSPPPTRD